MSIRDALYNAVHDYPGGAASLAPRMKLAASTLRCMANRNVESHDWPLSRVEQVIAFTKDLRPVHAFCEEHGGVFVPLPVATDETAVSKMLAEAGKDFGAMCESLNAALDDGRVTVKEAADFRQRVYDLCSAAQALEQLVEQRAHEHPLNRAVR